MPQIESRSKQVVSPWVTLTEKKVRFKEKGPLEVYHSLHLADYVSILAVLPDGRIPIIQQYRPAVEKFTWELPAGVIDTGESPQAAATRELLEETGLEVRSLELLGQFLSDTGRMENKFFAFLARTENPKPGFVPEEGTVLKFVTPEEIGKMIQDQEFQLMPHVGLLYMGGVLRRSQD